LQLSDEPTIERMQSQAALNGYRFNSLVEVIVTSPQFLNRRVPVTQQVTETKSPTTKAKL
jgi:hypothetical protein